MTTKGNCRGRGGIRPTRRDFMKISGLAVGSLTTGTFAGSPLGYARTGDLYPTQRIAWVNPNAPGGGYDLGRRSQTVN